MIVALHEAPKGFFKTDSPHSNDELLRLMRKTASLGFKAVQIGPLSNYLPIQGEPLRKVLDKLDMKRSVHVGGLFDAAKFALTEEEYGKAEQQMRYGVILCKEIGSRSVSVHPPYFTVGNELSEDLLSKARVRFLELLKKEVDFAWHYNMKVALESFCYNPFIFEDIGDFAHFVSKFPSERLGVLLDIGHLYQAGIDLSEAVHTFKDRLADIHVHDATLDKDYRKATHLPIGKGTIDFHGFINLLQEVRYDGWLTLEIRGNEEKVRESKEHLEGLLTQT